MTKKKFYFSNEMIKNIITSIIDSTPGVKSINESEIIINDDQQEIDVHISCANDVNVSAVAHEVQQSIRYKLQKQMNSKELVINVIVESIK